LATNFFIVPSFYYGTSSLFLNYFNIFVFVKKSWMNLLMFSDVNGSSNKYFSIFFPGLIIAIKGEFVMLKPKKLPKC